MIRSRLIYLALLIVAFIFSQALYDSISLFTLAIVLLIPIISFGCLMLSMALVKISLEPLPAREERLNTFAIRLKIRSRTPVMLPMMKFFMRVSNARGDEAVDGYTVMQYQAFGTTELTIPLRFNVRGVYKVGMESVIFYDFLRLFSIRRKLNGKTLVVVEPRKLPVDLEVQTSRQEQENTVTVGGTETKSNGDMAGIREFNEYDTLRQVHWKLSARLSKMIVKTYWENSCDNVMILADLFPYEEETLVNRHLTDCVVEITNKISGMLAENGVRCTLGYANYDSMLHLQNISTPEEQVHAVEEFSMTPMMESGALQESLSAMDFSSLNGGTLYIVTSMPADQLRDCMEPYVRGLNCDVEYLVVRPQPETEQTPNTKIFTLAELEEYK